MPSLSLYQLAMEFGRRALWERLNSEQLFALRLPDGRTGYCSVFGGSNPGMALYMGDESLLGLKARLNSPPEPQDWQRHRIAMEQRCIELRFERWTKLQPFSRKEILINWLPVENKGFVPEFRNLRPFKAPSALTEDQNEQIAFALEAALWLEERLYEGELGLRAAGFSTEGGLCPMIYQGTEGEWIKGSYPKPDFEALHYPSPHIDDEVGVARLRHLKRNGNSSLVCELIAMPELIQGDPPRYPAGMIIVDMTDGRIAAIPVVEDLEEQAEGLVAALLSLMQARGRPARVVARDSRTLDLISTALGQVGCPVERARAVRGMDQICRELYQEVFRHAQDRLREQQENFEDELMGEAELVKDFSGARAGECKCELCGANYTKGGMPNHLRGCRKRTIAGDLPYLLVRAEDMRFKQYYLYLAASARTNLKAVGRFLREIWADESGETGRFWMKTGRETGEAEMLDSPLEEILQPGDELCYEYDGIKIGLKVMERFDAVDLGPVELLARNQELRYQCGRCYNRARFVSGEGELLCPSCAGRHGRGVKKLENAPQDAHRGGEEK